MHSTKTHPRRGGAPRGQLSNWMLAAVAAALVLALLVTRHLG